jgi:hypothetical protein
MTLSPAGQRGLLRAGRPSPSEIAVDAKIEDQKEFVKWWTENVTNAKSGAFAKAEITTGISHQQVSRGGCAPVAATSGPRDMALPPQPKAAPNTPSTSARRYKGPSRSSLAQGVPSSCLREDLLPP